jgi:(p)ppGpp synthase/HD superfamily hydrolase
VSEWFRDKTDKKSAPYVDHLIHVRDNILTSPVRLSPEETNDARIVALLHDTLEDTNITADDLIHKFHIQEHIVNAVRILTHHPDVTYFEYIDSICTSQNKLAIAVKIADLSDNLRKCKGDTKFKSLESRYKTALSIIMSKFNNFVKT